jgi:hypothetical protein
MVFEMFLKQQLQESSIEQKPVLDESLDAFLNIEHCLGMITDLYKDQIVPETGSDTESLKTEILTTEEGKLNEDGMFQDDGLHFDKDSNSSTSKEASEVGISDSSKSE